MKSKYILLKYILNTFRFILLYNITNLFYENNKILALKYYN